MQTSGGEEEDFGSVDLVVEISTEVRASKSASPEEDLASDSVENHVTTEVTNGPSDEMQPSNEGSTEMTKLNNHRGRTLLSRMCMRGTSFKTQKLKRKAQKVLKETMLINTYSIATENSDE